MMDLFSDDVRRNPYPVYDQLRERSPVLQVPPPFDATLVFDYEGVRRVLTDHETFSSAVPAPKNWFTFSDPPGHSKLRALITRAFSPRVVANLEARIRELSRQLLDEALPRGEMDLAQEYAVPLPMRVIAQLLGIPADDWPRYRDWSDSILRLSYTRSGSEEAEQALTGFRQATAEMDAYLSERFAAAPDAGADDLLARLREAEVDGERLSQAEILGFFQLLLVAGQETTANLINNAVLCFMEHPEQLTRLRATPELLPSAIEEVLRYRSPLHWVMRTPRQDVEIHGQPIPAGRLVLPMIGSANRDSRIFPQADRFDIGRDPNPHVAFGHGIHFCLGAALARMEARIALADLLARLEGFEPASANPWPPRRALHVHGPASLLIRFRAATG